MSEEPQGQWEILAALQIAVFEWTGADTFRVRGHPPAWLRSSAVFAQELGDTIELAEHFPYLAGFLEEVRESGLRDPGRLPRSGIWVETDSAGGDLPLEATALDLGSRRLILIENIAPSFGDRQALYQKARDNLLTYQQLVGEIQQKEILLHCVIHDLGGPLMGIDSCLQWISQEELSDQAARRLQIGVKASTKLKSLVQDILSVFRAESELSREGPAGSTDLAEGVEAVLSVLGPAAALRGIRLEASYDPQREADWTTVGEPMRAERVLYNLIENAIRHSPEQGMITVTLVSEVQEVEVSVEDEGPGVPQQAVSGLFKKFSQSGSRKGKMGLGLYFCSIMVTRWGGQIGYRRGRRGGARFWFRLPRPNH